jgi:hypothetical protein
MVSRGTTQQSSAPVDRRIVLDVIRRQGTISRRERVELVSLSPQTVANITHDLQAIGLIVAKRLKGPKSRGQPPIAFELNPMPVMPSASASSRGASRRDWSIWWGKSSSAAKLTWTRTISGERSRPRRR